MDEKRNNNENLRVEFSKKTWKVLAESCQGAEGLAMTKILDLYGLDISDLDLFKIIKLSSKLSPPRCDPSPN